MPQRLMTLPHRRCKLHGMSGPGARKVFRSGTKDWRGQTKDKDFGLEDARDDDDDDRDAAAKMSVRQ